MIEGEKFARKCSVTGKGINEGWVLNDGIMYFSEERDALKCVQEIGYTTLKKAYEKEEMYWTDWYGCEDDYQYIVKNGELVEIE